MSYSLHAVFPGIGRPIKHIPHGNDAMKTQYFEEVPVSLTQSVADENINISNAISLTC